MLRIVILASLLILTSTQKLTKLSTEPSRLIWVTCKLSCPSLHSKCALNCEATQNGRTRQGFKILGTTEQLKDPDWLQNMIGSMKTPLLQTHGKQVLEVFLEVISDIIPNKITRVGKTPIRSMK